MPSGCCRCRSGRAVPGDTNTSPPPAKPVPSPLPPSLRWNPIPSNLRTGHDSSHFAAVLCIVAHRCEMRQDRTAAAVILGIDLFDRGRQNGGGQLVLQCIGFAQNPTDQGASVALLDSLTEQFPCLSQPLRHAWLRRRRDTVFLAIRLRRHVVRELAHIDRVFVRSVGTCISSRRTPMADGTAFTMVELKTTSTSIKEHYLSLGTWPSNDKLPIVYSRNYNVAFYGLEKLNSFDAWKLERIFQVLVEHGLVREGEQPSPVGPVPDKILAAVHEASYLQQTNTSKLSVIRLTELPGLILLPQFMIQRHIVTPLKYQVAGTVLALGIALERGWAIHLGGGMIHGSYNRGAGWCPYDDVSCAIHYARSHVPSIQRVMVIDLGAHQGNGYQNTKLHFQDEDLFIVDVYNEVTFPQDLNAREAINVGRSLLCTATPDTCRTTRVSSSPRAPLSFEQHHWICARHPRQACFVCRLIRKGSVA